MSRIWEKEAERNTDRVNEGNFDSFKHFMDCKRISMSRKHHLFFRLFKNLTEVREVIIITRTGFEPMGILYKSRILENTVADKEQTHDQ